MFIFDWISPVLQNMHLLMCGKKRKIEHQKFADHGKGFLEEFVLMLVRMRRGFDSEDNRTVFGLSWSHISALFTT